MAFNEKEKSIIDWGVRNGKSSAEIKNALMQFRSGAQIPSRDEQKPEAGILSRVITDIPSDVQEAFKGSVESVARGMQTANEVRSRVESGQTSPVAGTLQTIGAGLRAGAETVGNAVLGLGKMFTTQKAEEAIKGGATSAIDFLSKTAPAQELIKQYESFSPEEKRNIQGALGVAEGVGTLVGFGPILSKAGNTVSATAKTALTESDNILRSAVSRLPEVPKVPTSQATNLVKDIRFALSDIDPQVETILQRSNFDEVNQYFQAARNAKADPAKFTAMELAGQKGEVAYDVINEARAKAVQGKKAILDSVATERVSGNVLNDVLSKGIQRLNDQFGVQVQSNGAIRDVAGRVSKLDLADQKLIGEFVGKLNSLGIAPTIKQVDDFVDWAQSQLYKQSKTVSKYEVAGEPVVKALQQITGDLNGRLKETVGGGYGEVNARISRLIELQDELSSALGADARKGGGLMKRLFSPTGGDVRRIFEEIRQETGIDLVKEATLAKFAMESVGDVRQASLLKQLGVAFDAASELDLTKPLSIVKFIRERADLDAQELANEIIRRANASK